MGIGPRGSAFQITKIHEDLLDKLLGEKRKTKTARWLDGMDHYAIGSHIPPKGRLTSDLYFQEWKKGIETRTSVHAPI